MKVRFILLVMVCYSCQEKYKLPETILINESWQFKSVADTIWHKATVPGNVHSDLFQNGIIEDPFVGTNENDVQWISESDWEYKTTFSLSEETLLKPHIELNFEGLDTYASVYLNDSLILNANNAFRSWKINVKSLLRSSNSLKIVFESTSKYEEKEQTKLTYTLPEGERVFTRKAQFQYGWDWGPKLNTSGVWRPIKIIASNDIRIEDYEVIQHELNDSIAKLSFRTDLAFNKTDGYTFELFVNDTLVAVSDKGFQYSPMTIPFEIKNPKRWWPHNLGDPYLYKVTLKVREGRTVLDTIHLKYGLRTIKLVTEDDSIGQTFFFEVNDIPVYAKGANYIPQNNFQNKVKNSHYENLLNDVVEANMNMLRVWGGGIYENDIFYDLCDEKGILIWQDFMFACAMYPGDQAFIDNLQQEAIDNVKRLRNHASIALWCGNNENAEGWQNWGWQDNRSEAEKEEIWNNYLKVFDSIMPNTVARYTNTDYWESSPKYGRGNPKYKVEGDAHDWWVWHDAFPFEHFEDNVPRFMSEFGFQSFPSVEVLDYIQQSDSLNLESEAIRNHQKHTRGFQLIEEYMSRDFPVPDTLEDYVYMSQLVQAYGITKGIEAHRRSKPYNMGSLYWQLNDCWPSISWSSLDYFGNWKALHYKAKNSFRDLLLSAKVENNSLKTYLINDMRELKAGNFTIKIMQFNGEVIWEESMPVDVVAHGNELIHEVELKKIKGELNQVVAVLILDQQTSLYYFNKPKNLQLPYGEIHKKIKKIPSGFQIELRSETLQKDVYLSCNEAGHFTDNYFDILPNETKIVQFKTEAATLSSLNCKTFNSFIR